MLQFLKFRPMNERQAVWPNFPWPFARLSGVCVITDHDRLGQVLSDEDNSVYQDHRHLTWLNHLAIGRPGDFCYLAYKESRLRGLPGAYILSFSDSRRFLDYRLSLGSHLLFRHGLLFTRTESRLLHKTPRPGIELKGFRNKVFRSDTLSESDISNLYTEIVALDI